MKQPSQPDIPSHMPASDQSEDSGPTPVQTLKFRVGDVCVTQNSRYPEVNNGVVVAITRIDPWRTDRHGQSVPYWIERTDGSPLALVNASRTGEPMWFRCKTAACAESRLRRLRPDELLEGTQQRESPSVHGTGNDASEAREALERLSELSVSVEPTAEEASQ